MYNRYIPQPDGSHRRNPVPDPCRPHAPKPPPKESCPPPPPEPCPRSKPRQEERPHNFLKQLLPKDFDTGDLIVILLLLLMAGDCEEDRNNALLTIALYFMM